jgi:hypothetical protein
VECRDCPLFDESRGVCRSGKLNPASKERAAEVVSVFGVRALCVFNEQREPLVQRMFDKELRGGLLRTRRRRWR